MFDKVVLDASLAGVGENIFPGNFAAANFGEEAHVAVRVRSWCVFRAGKLTDVLDVDSGEAAGIGVEISDGIFAGDGDPAKVEFHFDEVLVAVFQEIVVGKSAIERFRGLKFERVIVIGKEVPDFGFAGLPEPFGTSINGINELPAFGPDAVFGIDIPAGSDTGLAVLTTQGAPISFLYTINLTTGTATQVQNFHDAPFIGGQTLIQPIRGMAVKTNGSIGFASATAGVSEGAGKGTITLNRTGDLSGAASVDFATSDGTAVQISDYHIGFGTVLFAPGETSKTFDVLITDDGYMESPETFTISLNKRRWESQWKI